MKNFHQLYAKNPDSWLDFWDCVLHHPWISESTKNEITKLFKDELIPSRISSAREDAQLSSSPAPIYVWDQPKVSKELKTKPLTSQPPSDLIGMVFEDLHEHMRPVPTNPETTTMLDTINKQIERIFRSVA